MAHQRTGAAPPPDALALPATTPRPGGPVGECGPRSSPAPPEGGALVRCACEATAWRGGFGGCEVTSGGAAEGTACAGPGPAIDAAHSVVMPGARCAPAASVPAGAGHAESGKPTRRADAGRCPPSRPSPIGKASGGGARRTCAAAASGPAGGATAIGAAGAAPEAGCVALGVVGAGWGVAAVGWVAA